MPGLREHLLKLMRIEAFKLIWIFIEGGEDEYDITYIFIANAFGFKKRK